jgi:hypothetical protein
MNKEEAINKVNEGIGSIYTKEDVINIINKIETSEEKFDGEKIVEAVNQALEVNVDRIMAKAKREIEDDNSIDMSSCDFEIENGNQVIIRDIYWNSYIIEEILGEFRDEIQSMVQEVIVDACSPNNELQEELDKASEEGSTEHQ